MEQSVFIQYGVLGLLGVVIVILVKFIHDLSSRHDANQRERDGVIMGFVDRHRAENSATLEKIATAVSTSQKDLGDVMSRSLERLKLSFDRQSRMLDEVLLTTQLADKMSTMKSSKSPSEKELTREEIEKAYDIVIRSRQGKNHEND